MIGPWSPAADLLDAQSAAVVSVTWAGRIWRLSSVALTGDAHIDPGLVEIPDLDDEISIESGGDVGATASIAVVLPCISIADYTAAGYDPTDITAEIAIVYHRGGVLLHKWAARDVRLSGWAMEPEWGYPPRCSQRPPETLTCSWCRSDGAWLPPSPSLTTRARWRCSRSSTARTGWGRCARWWT